MGDFKGIWVSESILDLGLSPAKSMVLSMIKEMQPFTASNSYIAKKLNISPREVSRIITLLSKWNIISITGKTSARVIAIDNMSKDNMAIDKNNYRQYVLNNRQNVHSTIDNMSATIDKLSTNNKYNKEYNKEYNNKPTAEPKVPAKRSKPKKKVAVDELYEPTKKAFLFKNNNHFDNWGKEGKAIKDLITKARYRDNPEEFMNKLLNTFYSLTVSRDTFWRKQPFLPSVLNAGGIFPRVLKEMEEEEKDRVDIDALPSFEFTGA